MFRGHSARTGYDNSLITMSQTQRGSKAVVIAKSESWQDELRTAIRTGEALLARLGLAKNAGLFWGAVSAAQSEAGFKTLVTETFARKMRPGDPNDPLLLQVLPRFEETARVPGFGQDPVGENAAERLPGLIQKYRGRALLILTPACAAHCRYCFRREYPYEASSATGAALAEALRFLRDEDGIREIILSGGDPLIASDETLGQVFDELESIPHLHTIRIHTRLPVFLPSRFTPKLLGILKKPRLKRVLVAHVNHASELDAASAEVFENLRAAGWTLLSQSVLLRGVNDKAEILSDLSAKLFDQGVLPYYLHQLDRVIGSAHFEVPEAKGGALISELRAALPGYLVPRYVRESAGFANKLPL